MKVKKSCMLIILTFVSLLFVISMDNQVVYSEELTKVVLAEGMQPPAAPIYVAKEKGFWKEEGLDVELKPFTMGRLCMDAVLGGRADVGYMAETPPMLAAFKDEPLRLIAAFESSNTNAKALVRKDLGISKPSDLTGKKVAVSIGTNGEYFMGAYLKAKGVDRKKLKVVNLGPADMVTAIVKGEVVAIFTWEPHITNAKEILKDKAEIWFGGDIYREGFFLGLMEGYIKKNPEVVNALLKGLIKAEKFIKENPDEAIRITAPRVNMKPEVLKSTWKYYEFRISLEKFHLDTLKGEAEWAIESGIAPKGAKMPDLRKFLYDEPLKKIDPSRVKL